MNEATPPLASRLPNPRHAERLPPHFTPEQIERVRQGAYNLPQVVKPADYLAEDAPGFETHLDGLGLILLQRAVPSQRPSRWISPGLIDSALQHLESPGVGRETRALMLERSATLDAMGLTRAGDGWERLFREKLRPPKVVNADPPLDAAASPEVHFDAGGGQAQETLDAAALQVAFRHSVPAEPVWAFFRTGDKAALVLALGRAPRFQHAAELHAHLLALIERSEWCDAKALDSLIPRLQAECLRPQPIADLKLACTRAQDRWERQVNEQQTLSSLNHELAFQGYPDRFDLARQLKRRVTLFVGPPNSGKTYAAFERLAGALDGAYLAPLRLLALEGRDRLAARGVPCSLLTGEERVPADGARVVSSTIEMVGTREVIDVAVIDEAQMIFDHSRGWAWTQAIVGVPAREVIIICSGYAVPAIESLLGLCGEAPMVRQFERKQHVELLKAPVPLAALKKGDAVVAFSRREVLMLRDQIAANGHPVSVVYGALPPEVRRREAERFAQGESHILVATDAIGMGLNLPIRRVLFSTMTKFDGVGDRSLNESEVHQIAGRAGRFGMHEEGFTGVLHEAEPTAGRTLKDLLPRNPKAPRNFKAPVAPNWWHVSTIAERLGKTRLQEVLQVFMEQLRLDNAHFQVAELEQMLELAGHLDENAATLSLKERFIYAQAPVDSRTEALVQSFLAWAWQHARTGEAGRPDFLGSVDERSRLERMEQSLRACTLWLWLDLRFPGVYGHLDEVVELRSRLNDGIERHLKGKKPLWQARGGSRPR